MRFDKLTTKFQQALNDAQSLAVGADNTVIEPQHLLLALLNQEDGIDFIQSGRAAQFTQNGLECRHSKSVENL
jgi:ATP-dependent Clp protease ATP-binding subunit ClpA